jgi:hypothetical protein
MNHSEESHHEFGATESGGVQETRSPYWKRAHRDWRVWVAVIMMIAGMVIYVMSEDLSVRPGSTRSGQKVDAM